MTLTTVYKYRGYRIQVDDEAEGGYWIDPPLTDDPTPYTTVDAATDAIDNHIRRNRNE